MSVEDAVAKAVGHAFQLTGVAMVFAVIVAWGGQLSGDSSPEGIAANGWRFLPLLALFLPAGLLGITLVTLPTDQGAMYSQPSTATTALLVVALMGAPLSCGFYFVVTLFIGSVFAHSDMLVMREAILNAADWWKILLVTGATAAAAVAVARMVSPSPPA